MRSAIIIILLFCCTTISAQVSGFVADSITLKPLSFATVRLLNEQYNSVKSTIADSLGHYRFQLIPPGKYLVSASVAGYRTKISDSFILPDSIQVTLLLRTNSKNLSGVTVVSQRPLVTPKIDGFVYDARQDIPVPGEDATDLLRRLPGVQVSPDGVPSMRGSTRIKVFIDGKPSEAYAASVTEAMRQISTDNILRVEIITQPSARYDAEGVDGVINIITKKPLANGSSGTVNGYVGNRNRQVIGNMAIRKNKFIFNIDAGHYYNSNETHSQVYRNDKINGNELAQHRFVTNKGTNWTGGLTTTFIVDTLFSISASVRYGNYTDRIYTTIDNTISISGNAPQSFTRNINNPFKRTNVPISWSLIKKSRDKSAEFGFLGNYFNQQVETNYSLLQSKTGSPDYAETNENLTVNKELALQADYSKNYNTNSNFETGVKVAIRKFHNTSLFVPDQNRSDRFFFPRDIWAAYASYTFTAKDWKIRAGLRYEHTVSSVHLQDTSFRVPDYKNLLPNIIISRSFGAHTISAGYSRKIYRPYLASLNPVISYIDSLNIAYGNPYLEPPKSNNYDLIHTFLKNKWLISTNLFVYQIIKSIETVSILQSDGIVARTYQNISANYAGGAAITVSYRDKKLTVNSNNTIRYISFQSNTGLPDRNGWVANLGINATYKITSSLTAASFVTYNTTRVDLQGSTTGASFYNFLVIKTFKEAKYALSFRIDNFFMPFQTITETNETADFYQSTRTRNIRRFFRIGFSYKFGKKEIRVAPVRTISSEG